MAVTLLSIANGTSSLEFATTDSETVRQAISCLFGTMTTELHASYSRLVFGGESFLFEQEWDAPCLIASTEAGNRLLAQIEQRLAGTTS